MAGNARGGWRNDAFFARLASRRLVDAYGLGGGGGKDISNSDALEQQPLPPSPGRIFPSTLEGPGARDYDSPDTAVFDHSNSQMPYHEGDAGAPIDHRDIKPANVPMEIGEIEIEHAGDVNNLKDLVEGRMDAPLNDYARQAPRHEAAQFGERGPEGTVEPTHDLASEVPWLAGATPVDFRSVQRHLDMWANGIGQMVMMPDREYEHGPWFRVELPTSALPGGKPYSPEQAMEYAELDPAEMPEVVVQASAVDDALGNLASWRLEVLDGEHRIYMAKKTKRTTVPAFVGFPDWTARPPRNAQRQPWCAVDLDNTILEEMPAPEVGDIDLSNQPSADGDDPSAPQGPNVQEDMRQIPLGPPKPGAADALVELARLGWRISIYTARFGDESLSDEVIERWAKEIAEHLKGHGVPFSDIWVGRKPRADFFVDDKAIHFDGDWNEVLRSLTMIPSPPRGSGESVPRGDVAASGGPLDYADDPNNDSSPLGEHESRGVDRPPELEGILTARRAPKARGT